MSGEATLALNLALGSYPRTEALKSGKISSLGVTLQFENLENVNRAFAPMVRKLRYDVSELAIATFLQAKSAGVPIVLLPVVLAARFQQPALLCLADGPVAGPGDLKGRNVGVRAYSQTTAMWLRGILNESFGIRARDINWLTLEGAHVEGIVDPSFCRRAPDGQDLLDLLRRCDVDAIIVGNEIPKGAELRTVFPDPDRDAQLFFTRYHLVPINHMLTMRADLAERRPDIAIELVKMFRQAAAAAPPGAPSEYPITRAQIEAGVALALQFTSSQDILPNDLDDEAVWRGTPPGVWEVL